MQRKFALSAMLAIVLAAACAAVFWPRSSGRIRITKPAPVRSVTATTMAVGPDPHVVDHTAELATLRARVAALEQLDNERPRNPAADDDRSSSNSELSESEFREHVEEAYSLQMLDDALADIRRSELRESMESNPHLSDGTAVAGFSCGESMCRVELTHDNAEAAERFRGAGHVLFPWAQAGHVVADESGGSLVYVSADGRGIPGG